MKLFPTLIALLVSGFANAQHHLPAAATSNINGINSPTSNVDIDSIATISDEADDTAARKLHDGSGRRLSKSHKSDKGIDHGHDGSSSKTAKSEGTDGSAKTAKESKSSKSAETPDDDVSDRRLKENIKQVGRSPSGISIYTFKYRDDMAGFLKDNVDTNSVYLGVMAQELLDIAPEAVVTNPATGYYAVDYSKIDVDFRKVD